MPDQKYRPLRTEEEGEVGSSDLGARGWNRGLNTKQLVVHFVIFIAGLLIGSFLNRAHPQGAADEFAQYSMVPCKF
jgi:hypothetical protein